MTKDLWIDADHLLHFIAGTSMPDSLGGEEIGYEIDISPHQERFTELVAEYKEIVEVEMMLQQHTIRDTYLVFSDSAGNFRKQLYPEYKANRKGKVMSPEFYALREWANSTYIFAKGCEADDVVAYYVKRGAIGVSTDKDLLKGVEGTWYDSYHKEWVYTDKDSASRFVLLQSLAGDSTDGIKGLPKVGMKTAEKLLDKYGDSWDGVVKAYSEAGLTEEDAILTRRLVSMTQWKPNKGVRLWRQ